VRVEVRDRGPGVPAELHERIFEKFVRAAAPERHAEGAGLGLAICKGLVEAHGGRIWVEGRPGGGAAFGFSLPVEPAPGPQLQAAAA
jgi:two-component system sensor histidine kinase KdpD